MNCKECQELITPAVDRCLGDEERTEFSRHLEQCGTCRREYELERRTKTLIQHRAPRVAAPPELQRAVRAMVLRDGDSDPSSREVWWMPALSRRVMIPALALAAALVAFIVLWPSPVHPPEQAMTQAARRFAAETAA